MTCIVSSGALNSTHSLTHYQQNQIVTPQKIHTSAVSLNNFTAEYF